MARVHIPALLRGAAGGQEWVDAAGATVREVVDSLERVEPGLRGQLVREGRLVPGLAVAVDGEISSLGLAEPVGEETEVQFLATIQGG